MSKKQISQLETAKAMWEDTIAEQDVVEKFKVTAGTLRKMRRDKVITKFRYITLSKTGNPTRPGKKPVYSLIELVNLFAPAQQIA